MAALSRAADLSWANFAGQNEQRGGQNLPTLSLRALSTERQLKIVVPPNLGKCLLLPSKCENFYFTVIK
jgi:hypothetical protein